MPLKIVSRKGRQDLYIRGTVRGQSLYESTGTADPKQAEAYRAKREAELWAESVYGKRAVVTFAAAVTAYLEAEQRSETTLNHVERLLKHFGKRKLTLIDQGDADEACKVLLRDGANASPATKIRGVLTPLRAILEFAAVRGWCDKPAFQPPRVPQTKMLFIRPDEAVDLVNEATPHVRPLLVFLIGTGARMSEALDLDWSDVDLPAARAVVWQKQGTERHIDLPPVVVLALAGLPYRSGRVFRPVRSTRGPQGLVMGDAYYDTGRNGGGQIKNAWSYACKRAGLPGRERIWTPKGETKERRVFVPSLTPHCLRHTWATWHYCIHKDLLKLKEDGGWQTITMVTRYAKKMPDHHREAVIRWLENTDWPDIVYAGQIGAT